MLARRHVPAPHLVQAKRRHKVRRTIDRQNPADSDAVIQKSYKRAGHQHSALHAHQHRGVCAGKLAFRNDFLHQSVHRRPIHRRAHARDQRHRVQMPQLQMAAPRDKCRRQHRHAARQIEHHSEVTPVQPVNEHATKEGNQQTRQRHHDHLQADFDGGMRGREDVPAHTHEVHTAAEQRHKHGQEEIAEPALRPDQLPVDSWSSGWSACHRTTSLLS